MISNRRTKESGNLFHKSTTVVLMEDQQCKPRRPQRPLPNSTNKQLFPVMCFCWRPKRSFLKTSLGYSHKPHQRPLFGLLAKDLRGISIDIFKGLRSFF